MARTLPAGMATNLAEDGTAPRLFLYLGFQTPIRLYSGSGTAAYLGETWVGNGFQRRSLSGGPDGRQDLTIDVPNNDQAFSSAVLNHSPLNTIICRLYEQSGADTVQIFDGTVSDIPVIGPRVTLRAINRKVQYEFTPRLTVAPHVFNHITPSGIEIFWGNRVFRLKTSDEL